MAKYRKLPVVIEAVQVTWENWSELCEFIKLPWGPNGVHGTYHKDGAQCDNSTDKNALVIPTLEGNMLALKGDYIIKGVNGEYYPCKPDIFEKTYEEVLT